MCITIDEIDMEQVAEGSAARHEELRVPWLMEMVAITSTALLSVPQALVRPRVSVTCGVAESKLNMRPMAREG
jgi:hypothetical protein